MSSFLGCAGMLVVAAVAVSAGGCATPAAAVAAHASGNFEQARQEILSPVYDGAKERERDRLVWLMEEGKICLDAGDAPTGAASFARASDWCERFAIYEPKTTVQEEMASIAVNSTLRTYRGTYSDRILVDAYAVLASLWTGDTAKAAVYANRVAERQQDAEVEQAKQIAKVEREMGGWRGGAARGMLDQVRGAEAIQSLGVNAATASYLDPFATWISAIAWSATGDAANLERARVALSRAAAMVPGNTVLLEEASRNPFVTAAERPVVIVLFEAGRCMSLDQVIIPVATPWSGYNPIPIPVPREHPCDVSALTLIAPAGRVRTEALSDNDAIFKAQYDRMLPEVVFRTALMVGAKAGATVAATQATRKNDAAVWAILAGMSLYQAITNQADLRSWNTVGKFTQIAQVDRPPDGRLQVSVVGASGAEGPPATVDLPPGPVVFLYVRSMHAGSTAIHPFVIRIGDSRESTAGPAVGGSS